MTPTKGQMALTYAANNWRVFPVNNIEPDGTCSCQNPKCSSPGKHPMTKNGVKDATTDTETIKQWWTKHPDANIGIATGNGLMVVDIDTDKGGEESFIALEEEIGKLPETLEVSTGGGGKHLYYQIDEPIRNRVEVKPGLDIRGEGGYVVAPPSNHVKGEYQWI